MTKKNTPPPSSGNNQSAGRIELSGQGMGVPSDDQVAERALEIAEIENRPGQPTNDDYRRAARELNAPREPNRGPEPGEAAADGPDARDPAEARGSGTFHNQNLEATDEQAIPDRLVREGVEEADHEHMLEARRAAGQQNEPTGDEAPGRETGGAK